MPSFVANGNIAPSRFVKHDTTTPAQGKVLQCGSTEKAIGISHEGTRNTPMTGLDDGYAAIAGENLRVYQAGEKCYLELGGTVVYGDDLSSDGDGKGVANTTDNRWNCARALQPGASGELILVEVLIGARY